MTNKSISDLLASNATDPETGEQIYLLHRSVIVPDQTQDRDDWDSPATIANIETIKKSSLIKLNNGKHYGIRQPLWVREADSDGNHKIIDGECRWWATEDAPEDIQYLPCIVRTGDEKEIRLDHTAANGARKQLSLLQTAKSIKRDKDEFGLTTEEILAVHGIANKTQLSKYNAIHKLNDRAKELVRTTGFQDVNLVYDLQKLDDEALDKLEKKIAKGDSFQQALKSVSPKDLTNNKGTQKPPVSESETKVAISVSVKAAKALAAYLDVPADLGAKELKAALLAKIEALAADEPEEGQ
jgi:ParB/RepB/Spo0J family partition protein